MKLRLYYPCKPYPVFQGFGMCDPQVCELYKKMGLKGHNGEDVACPSDTPLYAAHDGVVVYAGEDGSSGYLVVIRTDMQYDYKEGQSYFKSLYAHLKRDGIKVKAGQVVKTGDLIALSDNTGLSKGPHLHFGLKPVYKGELEWTWDNVEATNGYRGAIDPSPYWVGIFAQDVPHQIVILRAFVSQLLQKLADLLAKR